MADANADQEDPSSNLTPEDVLHQIQSNQDIKQASAIFIGNIRAILRAPKDELVLQMTQILNSNVINALRNQLFFVFIDTFGQNQLIENGFKLSDDLEPHKHLKNRRNQSKIAEDVFHLGTSIWEETISPPKLASDILSPKFVAYPAIIDSHSTQILDKLQKVIDGNNQLSSENKELKKLVLNLEKKVTELTQKLAQNTQQIQPSSTVQHSSPKKPHTPVLTSNPNNQQYQPHQISYSQVLAAIPNDSREDNPSSEQDALPQSPNRSNLYRHRPIRYNPTFGDRTPTLATKPIIGNPKPCQLFVGGFNPNVNLQDIKNTIELDTGIKVLRIDSNKCDQYNKSVMIEISAIDRSKAFKPETWCQGLIVRPFRSRSKKNPNLRHHQNQTSSVTSSNHHNSQWNQPRYHQKPNHWDSFH